MWCNSRILRVYRVLIACYPDWKSANEIAFMLGGAVGTRDISSTIRQIGCIESNMKSPKKYRMKKYVEK